DLKAIVPAFPGDFKFARVMSRRGGRPGVGNEEINPKRLDRLVRNVVIPVRNGKRKSRVESGAAIGHQPVGIPAWPERTPFVPRGRLAYVYIPFFKNGGIFAGELRPGR